MDFMELICTGHIEEAVSACTRELEVSEQSLSLMNRGIAHLRLGSYTSALHDFRRAAELDPPGMRSDGHHKFIGAVLWIQGSENQATETWRSVVTGIFQKQYEYSDPAGGIQAALLWWFGASRLGHGPQLQEAMNALMKLRKRSRMQLWPFELGQFVLGEIDEAQLRLEVAGSGSLKPRRGCQAAFYSAMVARLGDEHRKAGNF